MWLETSKKTKKRPGLGNFFYKSVATLPTSYSSFLATPEKSIFRGTARTAGRFLRPTSGSCRRVGRTRHEDNAARQDDLHLRHGRTGAKAIRNLTYWSYDRGEYVKFVINSHPSGFYWVSCAHGPSLQPTACRSLLNSLTTKTESLSLCLKSLRWMAEQTDCIIFVSSTLLESISANDFENKINLFLYSGWSPRERGCTWDSRRQRGQK